ncbi:MAG: DUF3823 domain-containing protein [Chitinophagaceae bacterium]
MKNTILFILCTVAGSMLLSCKKDNYKAPASTLSGRIVYKGEVLGLEYNQVPFQLYQFGFGKVGAIDGTFAPDGSYSTLLFDGDYKFIIPNGQGPFLWKKTAAGNPDTLVINVAGSKTQDIEVMPYYMIRTPQLAAAGGKVNATCKAEKIITDAALAKSIESVTLYVNKTKFVSGADNIVSASISGAAITDPNNIALSVTIPAILPAQNYVFATIAIKIAGVEDRIFAPVQKLTY